MRPDLNALALLILNATGLSLTCVGSVGQLIKIAMLRVKNALPFLEC
jgi:preprotein translocase subunit Sss1